MATKQSIIDNIANKILASNLGRLVLDTDLQEALVSDVESIVNESYVTTSVSDNQVTNNVFTTGGVAAISNYQLNIKKQGGVVHVNGNFTTNAIISANNVIATITNSEYSSSDSVNINAFNQIPENDNAFIVLQNDELKISGSGVSGNETFNFSFTYFVGQ